MKRPGDVDADFKLRILKQAPLFRDAAEEDLAELARVARALAAPRGKPLARAGAEGEHIYVLQSGVAAELQGEGASKDALLVGLIGAGGTAGLVSALSKMSAQESAPRRDLQCISNVSALAVPAADFFRICRRSSALSLDLAAELAAQAQATARSLVQSVMSSLEARLAGFFARIADLTSTEDWNPSTNIGQISQSAVAAMLGVSREHVNRTLAMWERSGLIFQNKAGEVHVQNRRRLGALAAETPARAAADRRDDWLWEIDAHLDHGLNQAAQHLAMEAVKRAPKEISYAHRAVLATARSGAHNEALALFFKLGLEKEKADEDIFCLKPRIQRDLAYALNPDAPDLTHLEESAKGYSEAFRKTRGFYSGINASAGHALLGDVSRARKIAGEVSAILATSAETFDEKTYFRAATSAECRLLEGDSVGAASLFADACAAEDVTAGKRATSRRLLRRLARTLDIDATWIDRAVPQPKVLFFSGPLARKGLDEDPAPIDGMLDNLSRLLDREDIGWACGALASGADIAIAEALIEAGVALNVYLPLSPADFLRSSVHSGGPEWRDRFVACMRSAATIDWNRRALKPCNAAYRLGAEIAMGRTIRQAEQLETDAIGFFAAQEGFAPEDSLSVANLETWRHRGLPYVEVRDAWPGREVAAAPLRAVDDEEVLFALVAQAAGENGRKAPAPRLATNADQVLSIDAEITAFLFSSFERAIEAARAVLAAKEFGQHRVWLDAGVFDRATLSGPGAVAAAPLITATCKPLTEAGAVYASDAFANVAALAAAASARFEYVGYVPTKEKLDPCAMHQMHA